MLEEQCKTWGGISSVAVYWPLIFFQSNNTEDLRAAEETAKKFHDRMEAAGQTPEAFLIQSMWVKILPCCKYCSMDSVQKKKKLPSWKTASVARLATPQGTVGWTWCSSLRSSSSMHCGRTHTMPSAIKHSRASRPMCGSSSMLGSCA